MKKQITFVIIFFSLIAYSQNKKEYSGIILYEQVTNFSIEFIEEYQLFFTKNWSFNQEINSKKKEAYKTSVSDNIGTSNVIVSGKKNITPKYFYNSINDFFFKDNFEDNIFVVVEEKKFPKWEFINETKKIGEFECKKAKVNFRGRNYFAWYAPQIPMPFGPWKARGLPGIILEFYEENYVFQISAKKITFNDKTSIEVTIPLNEIKNAINITEYHLKKEKIKDQIFQKISSQQPKGSKPIKRNKNCEDCNKSRLEIFDVN